MLNSERMWAKKNCPQRKLPDHEYEKCYLHCIRAQQVTDISDTYLSRINSDDMGSEISTN